MNKDNKIERIIYSRQGRMTAAQFFLGERFFENLAQERISRLTNYSYGFEELIIDPEAISRGRIGISKAIGILPDGTPFSIPENEDLPELLKVTLKYFDKGNKVNVYLSLPLNQNYFSVDSYYLSERYSLTEELLDDDAHSIVLNKYIIMTDIDNLQNFSSLQLTQLIREEGKEAITISPTFIPPMLNILNHKRTKEELKQLLELVHVKQNEINRTYVNLNRSKNNISSTVIEALIFQILNKLEGYLRFILNLKSLHPYNLYENMVMFSSELAPYTTKLKCARIFQIYNHENFELNFYELLYEIKNQLNYMQDRDVIEVKLIQNAIGTFHSEKMKYSDIEVSHFILAAHAKIDKEEIQNHLPNQIKISASSQIEYHMHNLLAGIQITLLPEIPDNVPYEHDYVYFNVVFSKKLEENWLQIFKEEKIAFHVSGDYPQINLRLWLVKDESLIGS